MFLITFGDANLTAANIGFVYSYGENKRLMPMLNGFRCNT
ncbi:hypothetical protein JCM19301_3873 [Jejuia pallidilutea]|uniref:Uncharacterized protein n=1 Tax=Jejuia pallidilutea TaxID=504487 RepID=A0A090VXM4_9FLAO|nr:hypothetical protein JCM19301_3873 [Jejuia pallidilutea]GAL69475.1 hypothetical protein JCM19302_4204 [Jejuia pallidilutea]GAL89028.1 hypothetical protein JCM19538_2017 [Jejuia pallidilutea]